MQVRYKSYVGGYGKFYIVTIRDDNNYTTVRATTMSQVKKIRKQCRQAQSECRQAQLEENNDRT